MLEKYGIVLIRSKDNVERSAFVSAIAPLAGSAGVESEVPVYSLGETNVVLTNEFIVQFDPNISESAINDIIEDNKAKVIEKSTKIENRYILTFEGITPKEALVLSNSIHENENVTFSEPNFVQIIPSRPKIRNPDSDASASSAPMARSQNDPLYSQPCGGQITMATLA